MLDWSARVDDVVELLQREFAISDRGAIEVLLSGLIPCPRTPAVWLILETNWFARECSADAWFSFGELWTPIAFARLRGRKPWREIELETQQYLEAPNEERLFVECDFERYPYWHNVSQAQFVLQRALRIRTHSTRVANPLRGLDTREEERRADQLAAYTRKALEDPLEARGLDPPAFREPAGFLYHAELVQKLAPWYLDWNVFVRAFAALAVRHAWVFGRRETDERDAHILARVAHDSVPVWIATALGLLLEGPAKPHTLEKAMCLEDKTRRSGHGAHHELRRLHRRGLIRWNQLKMHWAIAEEHRTGLAAILEGRAFQKASGASSAA